MKQEAKIYEGEGSDIVIGPSLKWILKFSKEFYKKKKKPLIGTWT